MPGPAAVQSCASRIAKMRTTSDLTLSMLMVGGRGWAVGTSASDTARSSTSKDSPPNACNPCHKNQRERSARLPAPPEEQLMEGRAEIERHTRVANGAPVG